MATEIVLANFIGSGAPPGSDLSAFVPALGGSFARQVAFPNNAIVATASGRFRVGAANQQSIYVNATAASTADSNVRARVYSASVGGLAGPLVRVSGADDTFYALILFPPGLALFKHVGGAAAQIGQTVTTLGGNSTLPAQGTAVDLEIRISGTTITGFFNGVQAIQATDAAIAGPGQAGLFLQDGAVGDGVGMQVESFEVDDPAATPRLTLPVSGAGAWLSPLNWDDDGSGPKRPNGTRASATSAWSTVPGAEGRFSWTTPATSDNLARLVLDVSRLAAGSIPTASYPRLKYRINSGPWHDRQVDAGSGGTCDFDVSDAGVSGAGTYTLDFVLMATSQAYDRWGGPSSAVPPDSLKLSGLVVDSGSTPVAPTTLGKTLVALGDSITEGVRALGTAIDDITSNDSTLVYARSVASALGCELASIACGGQGWTVTGSGNVPPMPSAFTSYSSGRPRDFGPPVDYVLCVHGTNDGLHGGADASVASAVATWLGSARAEFGASTPILVAVPPGGFKRSAIGAGFAQYQSTAADAHAYLIDGGPALQSGLTGFVTGGTFASPADGVHPDAATHARIASTFARAIDAATAPASVATSSSPVGDLTPSGTTFEGLRSGGLSGQLAALVAANPTLTGHAVAGLQAGPFGSLNRVYQGLSDLVGTYLRGDPIATAEVNARMADYASVFAGYAQAVGEIATLVQANPGTIRVVPSRPHATVPVPERTFP